VMVELPTGTVTLLFSDIEGSTALLSRLGPAYAEALDGQRRVLRTAWAANSGTELGTEGDSFFVVFPTAEGAVTAAAQAQGSAHPNQLFSGWRTRLRASDRDGHPRPAIPSGGIRRYRSCLETLWSRALGMANVVVANGIR
jgi:class 3 adenylate cyclase